jgi:hypothetical protein
VTLSALLGDLYRRLGYQSSPAAEVTTRLTAFLNETQREILSKPGRERLIEARVTLASVAAQPEYGLPASLARIFTVRDIANEITLQPMSPARYRAVTPDPSSFTGTPDYYVPLGLGAWARRPSDASELFAKSSDATDTTQTLHFEVALANGNVRTSSVALNGITAVSLSAALTTIVQINDLYLTAVTAGNVTIHEDSGSGAELARINLGQLRSWVQRIALVPTPADVRTYTIDGEREVTDLVQANDEPALPPRFHRMLGMGARMKEYEVKGDLERRAVAESEFDAAERDLNLELSPFPDAVIVPGGRTMGRSRLGPHFPADRWL